MSGRSPLYKISTSRYWRSSCQEGRDICLPASRIASCRAASTASTTTDKPPFAVATAMRKAISIVAARAQRARGRRGAQRAQGGASSMAAVPRAARSVMARGCPRNGASRGFRAPPAPPAARRCAAIGRATTGGAAAAASSKPSAGTGVQNLGPPPDSARRPEVLRRTDCVMSVALANTAFLPSLPSCENLGLPPGTFFFFFFLNMRNVRCLINYINVYNTYNTNLCSYF